jgi:8-oxo-dGTP diphosphatase
MPTPRTRRSARAILLDRAGRVLLIQFAVPRHGETFVFWATPGGEVEPGETGLETAKREIKEELAVNVELTGPVHTAVDRFMHNGAFVASIDIFFVGRLDQEAPRLCATAGEERAGRPCARSSCGRPMNWTKTTEKIFPHELGALVRRIL